MKERLLPAPAILSRPVAGAPSSLLALRLGWPAAGHRSGGGRALGVGSRPMCPIAVTQHDIGGDRHPMAGRLGDVDALRVHREAALHRPAVQRGVEGGVGQDRAAPPERDQDFSFLKALRVTIAPSGSPAPIELLDYEKKDGAVVGKLAGRQPNAVDILKQWKDTAVFDFQVAGEARGGTGSST